MTCVMGASRARDNFASQCLLDLHWEGTQQPHSACSAPAECLVRSWSREACVLDSPAHKRVVLCRVRGRSSLVGSGAHFYWYCRQIRLQTYS